MALKSRKLRDSFAGPGCRLVWPALVLFFVGGAICSFNPPAIDGQQFIKGEQIVNDKSESQANEKTGVKSGGSSAEIETATFALG